MRRPGSCRWLSSDSHLSIFSSLAQERGSRGQVGPLVGWVRSNSSGTGRWAERQPIGSSAAQNTAATNAKRKRRGKKEMEPRRAVPCSPACFMM